MICHGNMDHNVIYIPPLVQPEGGEISMAPCEDQEDVHNKTSSPGCEKNLCKTLGFCSLGQATELLLW